MDKTSQTQYSSENVPMDKAVEMISKNAPQRGRPEMSAAKRADMCARISEVAEKLFKSDGYANVSMRRISKEIGCSPMALYGYYDSKIDILRSLWGGVFDTLFEILENLPPKFSPQNDLIALGLTYVEYWLRHPEQYRLVFMAEGVTQPEVSVFLSNPEVITKYNIFMGAIFEVDPADASKDGRKAKFDFFLSTLHGIAHNQVTISGYEWSSPEQQIKYAVRAISTDF